MKHIVTKIISFVVISTMSIVCIQAQTMQGSRPNIIYILLDDLGYSDVGAYGGEIRTPNIDRLAKEGMKLPEMCNGAICNITRSTLLCGKYSRSIKPEANNSLPAKLKAVDYNTYMVGKSHLINHPNDIGFDQFYGFLSGQTGMYASPAALTDNLKYQENKVFQTNFPSNFYTTDACTDKAIQYINSNAPIPNNPFFLYLAYQAPHVPIQVPEDEILKYRGTFLRGWEAQRQERIGNMKKTGILQVNIQTATTPPTLSHLDWDNLTPEQRDLEDLRMSVYASAVDRVDQGIGKILAALEANGKLNNTLIVFSSDNATTNEARFDIESAYMTNGILPGGKNGLWFTGPGWSFVSQTPYNHYKSSTLAGGIKTGAIAFWPDYIKPNIISTNPNGAINKSMLHIADFMPTCIDAAYPATKASERDALKMYLDGSSMLPVFSTENIVERNKPIFFTMNDDRAVRTERWSLVEADRNQGAPVSWKLFDHRFADATELTDVAAANPAIVTELNKTWMDWWAKPSYSPLIDTRTFNEQYRVIPMLPQYRGTKYGYMEAVGSDHLNNVQSLQFPEKKDKPLATIFRGDKLQFKGQYNLGIDGYPIALDLSTTNIIHKLVLKEQTPAIMRLDLFSADPSSSFIFEYVNVPRSIFAYNGDYVNETIANNLVSLAKVNSMENLKNATQTSWYWENGSAFVKYVAPSSYTFTSKKGGFDNLFFCLNANCANANPKPILLSDFESLETRATLVGDRFITTQPLSVVTGANQYTLMDNGDGKVGCASYTLKLSVQNWSGVKMLNINTTGAVGSQIFIKDKSNASPKSIGRVTKQGTNTFELNLLESELDEVEAVVIRTCENNFGLSNTKTIRLNEMTLGGFSTIANAREATLKEEETVESQISIYPNPSNDGVFNLSQAANWKVVSILGKELKSGNSNNINLSEQPKGVYLIKLNEKIERVVVE